VASGQRRWLTDDVTSRSRELIGRVGTILLVAVVLYLGWIGPMLDTFPFALPDHQVCYPGYWDSDDDFYYQPYCTMEETSRLPTHVP
jgi:hypothetical protein